MVVLVCQERSLIIHLEVASSDVLVFQENTDINIGIKVLVGASVHSVTNLPEMFHPTEEALDWDAEFFEVALNHDYTIFKPTSASYSKYLTKNTYELKELPADTDKRWAMLGDNAYQGPESDTPTVRRIFVPRASAVTDISLQNDLKKLRGPVECFFGRMKHLWRICHTVYRSAHEHFDADINICVFLTNEHIRGSRLEMDDEKSFLAHQTNHFEKVQQEAIKRKKQQEKWKENKKKKLEDLLKTSLS